MEAHQVVPDVIPKVPRETASISYGPVQVNLGEELTPTQVKDPPTVFRWTTEPGALYTVLFLDPDIPKDMNIQQFNHWLVVNVSGADISKGETLLQYAGSGPREGTGLHRYVFLVYKQNTKIDAAVTATITDKNIAHRTHLSPSDLQAKFNLTGPVAGNFYRAQYDDYVPIIHQQFAQKYALEK